MKSYISKFFAGVAVLATLGLGACVGDLDQLPQDPNKLTPNKFKDNPREYLGEVMAKCYSSLAVSGQGGPNGSADLEGLDGGTSQYTRTVFMLEEFPTDECLWMYNDGGVDELRWGTWSDNNAAIYGTYSRLYIHIGVCNDFIRLATHPGDYDITYDAELQKDVDQLVLEARALRDLSYFYVIDMFGNGAMAWDDMKYGEVPPQVTRTEIFDRCTADLEDVLTKFQDSNVYGRLSKDGVEALLCRYYLNGQVYTGKDTYAKCWEHAQNIINRHKGGGYDGSGLAKDYLSLFCGNNRLFAPAGDLKAQNEILWYVPQDAVYTQPYGGSTFLVNGGIKNMAAADIDILKGEANVADGYMNQTWYGTNDSWGCMHARPQLSDKFGFVNGYSADGRTYLWLTEDAGFRKQNVPFNDFQAGYACLKFTAATCNADGSMPKFVDPVTGLRRAGVTEAQQNSQDGYTWTSYNLPTGVVSQFHNTGVPLIRLADVYLMAAECALRGSGNMDDALTYVNYIRGRAGVPAWNPSELTLSSLLDERARELYWECTRRTDLIRFGRFTGSNYLWAWKGGVEGGTALPDHFNLYPIPANVIAVYGNSFKQNPNY